MANAQRGRRGRRGRPYLKAASLKNRRASTGQRRYRRYRRVNEFGSVVAKGHRLSEGTLDRILRHHRSNCRVVENASVPR